MSDDDYGVIAELYDFVGPYRSRADVGFWVETARESGGPVLEVGCGTGRVLIPTARAGVAVTGLDLSAGMLRVCRERLAAEPADVRGRTRIVEADMRNFDLGQRFALVTVPFRPFQHLVTVADQIACLRTLHRHLQPGGRLVLDLFNPSIPMLAGATPDHAFRDEEPFTMPDGRHVVRGWKLVRRDLHEQVDDVEMAYEITHPGGGTQRLVHAFSMRYLFRFEAEHLLARCGFEVLAVHADYDRRPYGAVYPGDLVFVARKASSGEA